MPSPITSSDFDITVFGADVCERLRKLLQLNDTLKTFFEWMFEDDGTVTSAFKLLIQDIATPVGGILFRPVTSVPDGYLVANGQAVSRTTYANLFAVYGTTFGTGDGSTTFNLPNLQRKFLLGSDSSIGPGQTGGEENVTLTVATMPAHSHNVPLDGGGNDGSAKVWTAANDNGVTLNQTTDSTGGGQAHNNMPPYMAGLWLIKT